MTPLPPTQQERFDTVTAFILWVREYRVEMSVQHPSQAAYWTARANEADRVLADIQHLREHLHRLERELDSARRPIGGE